MMGDPIVAATVLRMRAMRADYAGDAYTELRNWIRIGELYVLMGDRRGCAIAHVNIGYGWMMMGMHDRAEASTRQGIQLTQELDMNRAFGAARHNLGMILALRGDVAGGLREEMQALEAMMAARDERLTLAARVYLAMIQQMAGELTSAEATARRALADIANLPPVQARAYATLVRILLQAGKTNEAAAFEPQLRHALNRPLAEGGDIYARLVHADLLTATGRSAEARGELEALKKRILGWAAGIDDEHVRAAYLEKVPENARVLALVSS